MDPINHLLEVIVPQLLLDTVYRLYPLSSALRRILHRRSFWWHLLLRHLKLLPRSIENVPLAELKRYYLRRMRYPIGMRWVEYRPAPPETIFNHRSGKLVSHNRDTYRRRMIHNRRELTILTPLYQVYRSQYLITKELGLFPEPVKQIVGNMRVTLLLGYSGRIYEQHRYTYRPLSEVTSPVVEMFLWNY